MVDLIDRAALMRNFCGYDLNECTKYGNKTVEQQNNSYSTMMMYEIADEIEDAPAVDAVEVVHGQWNKFHLGSFDFALRLRCSNCSRVVYEYGFNYCPHCGAKMKGAENNA